MSLSARQGVRFDGVRDYASFGEMLCGTDFKVRVIFKITQTTIFSSSVCGIWSENKDTSNKRHGLNYVGSNIQYDYFLSPSGTGLNIAIVSSPQIGTIYDITLERIGFTLNATVNGVTTSYTLDSSIGVIGTGIVTELGRRRTIYTPVEIYHFEVDGKTKILCNEGAGATLTDTSGNGKNGTVYGANWAIKNAGTVKAAPTGAKKNKVKPLASSEWFAASQGGLATFDIDGSDSDKATFTIAVTGNARMIQVPVEAGSTYTLSVGTGTNCLIRAYKGRQTNHDAATQLSGASSVAPGVAYTFTADSTFLGFITIRFTDSAINTVKTVSHLQLEKSSTATTFETYTGVVGAEPKTQARTLATLR